MIGTLPLTLGPIPAMAKPSLPVATPNALPGGMRIGAESSFTLIRRAHEVGHPRQHVVNCLGPT